MDLEKAKKDAQDQIDAALAEVARLKTVASDLEKKNKEDETLYANKEKALKTSLASIESNITYAKLDLQKIIDQIADQQVIKTELSKDIDSRREDLVVFEKLIADKKAQLESVEDSITKAIEKENRLVADKKKELENLTNEIDSKTKVAVAEEAKAKTTLKKLNDDITAAEMALAKLDESHRLITDEARKAKSEAEHAEIRKNEAERRLSAAENELISITSNIEANSALLEAKKRELEAVEKELKPLIAKRIDSINFMKELENKEAILKSRYEEVGLEY